MVSAAAVIDVGMLIELSGSFFTAFTPLLYHAWFTGATLMPLSLARADKNLSPGHGHMSLSPAFLWAEITRAAVPKRVYTYQFPDHFSEKGNRKCLGVQIPLHPSPLLEKRVEWRSNVRLIAAP